MTRAIATPRSAFADHGRRVVEGRRLMPAAGDMMLGWIYAKGIDGVAGP